MDTLLHFLGLILHIDKSLGDFIHTYGAWVYAVLFLIVFCETGLVVFPFLPGDSLLFIGGAFAATHEMDLGALIALLLIAAVAGNTVNYWIGRAIGPKVFDTNIPVLERFLDRKALQKTHNFYDRHGGKTIVIARFVPVVRTFAPFVAGASAMNATRFQLFNILGAAIWVLLLVLARLLLREYPVHPAIFERDRAGRHWRRHRADCAGRAVEDEPSRLEGVSAAGGEFGRAGALHSAKKPGPTCRCALTRAGTGG